MQLFKRITSVALCVIMVSQFISCKSNKYETVSLNTSEATSSVQYSDVETKFNKLKLKPDYFLAGSSSSDITDAFMTAYLEGDYSFDVNKHNAEKLLTDKIKEITSGKTTNSEKAAACYDWIIKNVHFPNGKDIILGYSNWVSLIVTLSDGIGNPFDYAYTYYAMLRYIGIDAKLERGYRSLETGGNSQHSWVTVEIDGIKYYFDPFTDDNNAELQSSDTCHDCFMKTYEEVQCRYVESEEK